MLHLTRRGAGLLVAALATMLLTPSGHAASTDVPAPGQSPKIDAIKERGSLRVAAIGEFPWLPENTTGSGPQFSGPAWVLAEEYAKRLDVPLEVVPVSRETKSSLCSFGLANNPQGSETFKTVDDVNRADLTIAYVAGTPPSSFAFIHAVQNMPRYKTDFDSLKSQLFEEIAIMYQPSWNIISYDDYPAVGLLYRDNSTHSSAVVLGTNCDIVLHTSHQKYVSDESD